MISLFLCSIEAQNIDRLSCTTLLREGVQHFRLELIHDQLPLAVPCYDLVPVIELTVDPREVGFRALPTPLT